jgi:hypothetical protein
MKRLERKFGELVGLPKRTVIIGEYWGFELSNGRDRAGKENAFFGFRFMGI